MSLDTESSLGSEVSVPKVAQLVVVRGRPAVVRDLRVTELTTGPQVVMEVEYIDGIGFPLREWVAWDREAGARVVTRQALPSLSEAGSLPDSPDRFQAFLHAFEWLTANRFREKRPREDTDIDLCSPWFNAVKLEDYQLYPVHRALLMPRITLLLADDVGLGKTIEAGLILSEMYSRRRVHRCLIICPASLQKQWQEELADKFHLDFTVLDRDQGRKVMRQFGVDANPWQLYPRIITSMDYLRQPDVLEAFRSTAVSLSKSSELPFQMLIVDEAHNLAPSVFNDDSDRSKMLRHVIRFFEHRLFLSATPHNGYTISFSGLLSTLDPVRVQQTAELTEDDHRQVKRSEEHTSELPSRITISYAVFCLKKKRKTMNPHRPNAAPSINLHTLVRTRAVHNIYAPTQ